MSDWFRVCPIEERLYQITDVAGTHFFLLLGEREAMLLDTGVGCGDLRKLVRELTPLPVKVLVTHGHVDHAMGAGQFEDAWMSPEDEAIYQAHSAVEERLGYIHGSMNAGGLPRAVSVTEADLQPARPFGGFHPLAVGDRFDLGGVTVKVCRGRGHTPGCVTALIPELRTLLLGDACNHFTYLFDEGCSTVEEYLDMLCALKAETDGCYDRVLVCHGPLAEGAPDMIDRVMDVCRDILRGDTDDMPFRGFHGEPVCIAKAMDFTTFTRVDGGTGNVVYNPNRIREEQEQQHGK